jgi:transcriptional regulator with XRE-family HTH domain
MILYVGDATHTVHMTNDMERMYDTPDRPEDRLAPEVPPATEPSSWNARVTRVVAVQIQYWRGERGLSAQQLAERTRELGYHVPRSVIANLENDRRDTIGVGELLVLAAALDVPPTMLVTPVGIESSVEILPGVQVSPWKARGWILGARHPDYATFSLANWENSRRAIVLYDVHRILVSEQQHIQHRVRRLTEHYQLEIGDVFDWPEGENQRPNMLKHAVQELVYSLDRIRKHRQLIANEGLQLPDLAPGLAVLLRETEDANDERSQELESRPTLAGEALPSFIFDLIRSTTQSRRGILDEGPAD